MRFGAFLVLLGCGHAVESPAPTVPVPRPVPIAKPVVARPLRLDRPSQLLGGPQTWASAEEVAEIRFCPGDRELVAVDLGRRLRRYRVDDGALLATTPIGAIENLYGSVDCRADGNALAFDADHRVMMVDPKGAVIAPPSPLAATMARFDDDGSVLALTDEGATRWTGDKVELAVAAHERALTSGIGEHGGYVEIVYDAKPARENGAWLVRNGARIQLQNRPSDVMQVAIAPDGAVVVADLMIAYSWVVKGKTAGRRSELLDMSGAHIKDIAATSKWFAALDGGSDVRLVKRPGVRLEDMVEVCGQSGSPTAMAISRDDTRMAIACSDTGIRIFDLATRQRISKDLPHSGAWLVAWSPDGRVAALGNGIQIWRGPYLVAKIARAIGRSLWWESATELGGGTGGLTRWTVVDAALDGVTKRIKIPMHLGARSAHGEILVAARDFTKRPKIAIVRGDTATPVTVSESKYEWLVAAAIDDAGKRAVVLLGQFNAQPSYEAVEIDVVAHTATTRPERAMAVAVGATGYVLAGDTGTLTWRSGDKTTPIGDHGSPVKALAIAGDLIAAGGDDGAISLWTASGTAVGKLLGHTAAVRSVAFAPDGKHLASTGADGTRVWDLSP